MNLLKFPVWDPTPYKIELRKKRLSEMYRLKKMVNFYYFLKV